MASGSDDYISKNQYFTEFVTSDNENHNFVEFDTFDLIHS